MEYGLFLVFWVFTSSLFRHVMWRFQTSYCRFKLIIKPDFSDASLHVINSSELDFHNFYYVSFQSYRICEDTLVSFWIDIDDQYRCGVYTGLTSARFANIISDGGFAARMLLPDIGDEYRLFPCPAFGRFVRLDGNNSVSVLDFF